MAQSGYSPETERRVERLLAELCEVLQIQRPDDLFGSVCIEARYQNGKPVGQVDVQVKYVMKRSDTAKKVSNHESRRPGGQLDAVVRRPLSR
jgi:hypothetical protein